MVIDSTTKMKTYLSGYRSKTYMVCEVHSLSIIYSCKVFSGLRRCSFFEGTGIGFPGFGGKIIKTIQNKTKASYKVEFYAFLFAVGIVTRWEIQE